jgi:hypothetical protein
MLNQASDELDIIQKQKFAPITNLFKRTLRFSENTLSKEIQAQDALVRFSDEMEQYIGQTIDEMGEHGKALQQLQEVLNQIASAALGRKKSLQPEKLG